MSDNHRYKPASQQELSLYCFVGEAVCAIQHVEDALSHSIVMKTAETRIKSEADQLLEKHRSYTLGKAIKLAYKEGLYSESLQQALGDFLAERNWLIHKSIAQGRDEWDLNISSEELFRRIKTIATQAYRLVQNIEEDMLKFVEAHGEDMSRVRAVINKQYDEERNKEVSMGSDPIDFTAGN